MSQGLTARIRAEITKRPLSVAQLCKLVSERSSKVHSMLDQMKDVLVYDRNPTRYVSSHWRHPPYSKWPAGYVRPTEQPARRKDFGFAEDIRVAQRVTIPQYRYGSTRAG